METSEVPIACKKRSLSSLLVKLCLFFVIYMELLSITLLPDETTVNNSHLLCTQLQCAIDKSSHICIGLDICLSMVGSQDGNIATVVITMSHM